MQLVLEQTACKTSSGLSSGLISSLPLLLFHQICCSVHLYHVIIMLFSAAVGHMCAGEGGVMSLRLLREPGFSCFCCATVLIFIHSEVPSNSDKNARRQQDFT